MSDAKFVVAGRMERMAPSPTLEMTRKALEMKAAGQDVIMLAAGEPDFETPEHIKQAAIEAIERGETRYTIVDGTLHLKAAIAAKFHRENGLSYDISQISVGAGGKQIISNALLASVGAGDEVIIPSPYWVSYPDMVRLCEGTPIIIPACVENGYKLCAEDLARAITSRTKWLILNSPCNPTGAVYSKDELRSLSDVLMCHPHVNIMSDDIYEHIIYDGLAHTNIVQIEPALQDRTLIVNGVSKAYNMTGWRIGYGAGPASLIKAMGGLQGQLTSNPCSISQAAAFAALEGSQDFIVGQIEIFQQRRDKLVAALNAIRGISCPMPQGAFYVYPSCAGLIGALTPDGKILETDKDVVTYFLERERVVCVHGAAFGVSPCFRISYAVASEVLDDACQRIAKAVNMLAFKA